MAEDGGRHPLADGCPPEWASAWGEDTHGVFVQFRVGAVEQRMRWIRPGVFVMGSPRTEEWRSNDETQHRVTLSRGYWLADSPVTQALWQAVTGDTPSRFQGDARRPVERVSWHDCQYFCARLGERMRGPTFRLPTEAEWEYACRAGTQGATYAPSNLDDIAWYDNNSDDTTHAVKEKLANQWGLHDMLGNVWEWCSDFGSAAQQDSAVPAGGERRVMRGGSWGYQARYVRAALRGARDPRYRSSGLGLRLALDQDE